MLVTADAIIKAASLFMALSAFVGAIIAVYKTVDNNKKQNSAIIATQEEQTIICYALQGCLQGLIEQGCNGPCKEALSVLQKHLNKKAHDPNL